MPGVAGRSGGANRKSPEVHALTGTYRRDRHGSIDRGNLAVMPARPRAHRDPDEREIRRVVRDLTRPQRDLGRRLLAEFEGWTPTDTMLLRLALEALDRRAECRKLIETEGLVLRGKRGGSRPHPLARTERQAAAFAVAVFRQLALGGAK